MIRFLVSLTLTTALLAAGAQAATVEQVDQAIRKHVDELYGLQKNDNWDEGDTKSTQYTGRTALACYALLSAGDRPQSNPKLAAAIEWLKKTPTNGIYALGLRQQVWMILLENGDKSVRDIIRREGLQLGEGARQPKGTGFRGLYHYLVKDHNSYDASCSQYGVLGMWAVAQAGLELPDAYWLAVERAWVKNQDASGGWSYVAGAANRPVTLNMTAAGIATLFITQDMLRSNSGLSCTGNTPNPPIDKAIAWMQKNLPDAMKRGRVDMYGMYGLERIGTASGLKYFGDVDWYKMGADRLVKLPSWNYRSKDVGNALGLLFLVHGRAPVAINKLQYSVLDRSGKPVEAHWNQRPRDISNAVHYIGEQIERRLNWQIVNLNVSVADLHDAPILYIGGNELLNFSDADKAKLKQYVEDGGLIVGHADCGHIGFANTFKQLGIELFPKAEEFGRLDDEHPIYTRQQFPAKKWRSPPAVLGLSNGVRELMLLLPAGDPAKAWQLNDFRSKAEDFQLIDDIFLYTTEGRDLRYKGDTYLVSVDPKIKTTGSINVARLDVGDNPDPEPAGWRRLAAVMHNRDKLQLTTQLVPLDAASLKDVKIAHLTGTGPIRLDEDQQHALRAFLQGGGTLIIDAAGGDSAFGLSIDEQLRALYPEAASQLQPPLPASDPIYQNFHYPSDRRMFRAFARTRLPGDLHTPQLRGLRIGDRLAVIVSREDLSAGLVGQTVDGIVGYTPDAATQLVEAVLLHVAKVPPRK